MERTHHVKKNPALMLLNFVAALALLISGGALVALRGPRGILAAPAIFVVPDAYATVTGSFFIAEGAGLGGGSLEQLSVTVAATLFGATVKLQGSNDALSAGTGNWVDLTTQKADGSANIVDVAIAAAAAAALVLEDIGGTAAASAGLNFKAYRVQAKNTVAASIANVAVAIFGA